MALVVVAGAAVVAATPAAHVMALSGATHATAVATRSQVTTFVDPRGDAPARADLTVVRVVSTGTAFKVRAAVANLRPRGTLAVATGLSGWGYWWNVKARRGHAHASVIEVSEVHTSPSRPCGAAKVRWDAKRNLVMATLPYSCTGSSPDGGVAVGGARLHVGRAADTIGDYFPPPQSGSD